MNTSWIELDLIIINLQKLLTFNFFLNISEFFQKHKLRTIDCTYLEKSLQKYFHVCQQEEWLNGRF